MKGRRMPDMERLREYRPRRPRWLHRPDLDLGRFRLPELDVPAHLLVPGIAVVLMLFGGGLYFGNLLGSDPSAAGTGLITTVTIKGTVTTIKGKPVRVTIRGRTVTRHGKPIKQHRKTVDITQTQTQTQTQTRTQQVPVPTTVTRTSTIIHTQTVTTTTVSVTTITVSS
jgi:hypothetical protein